MREGKREKERNDSDEAVNGINSVGTISDVVAESDSIRKYIFRRRINGVNGLAAFQR